jgi:hypothetical protein
MDIFWMILQDKKIGDAQLKAGQAANAANSLTDVVGGLEKKLDALVLLNQALVEILIQKSGVTEGEILSKASEIEHRAGAKAGSSGERCVKCDKPYSIRLNRCLYCGNVRESGGIVGKLGQ